MRFRKIMFTIFVLAFIVATYKLFIVINEYRVGELEYEELRQSINVDNGDVYTDIDEHDRIKIKALDFDKLKDINKDIVAWIIVPGTHINYPVMHTDNNTYYLDYNFEHKRNIQGGIFIDYLNSPDLTDYNTIIYGHRTTNGRMFADIKYYMDKDFFDKHRLIYILTPNQTHSYVIFSFYQTYAQTDSYVNKFKDSSNFMDYVKMIKDKSMYETDTEVNEDNLIITLSTCVDGKGENKYLVHAKKIE